MRFLLAVPLRVVPWGGAVGDARLLISRMLSCLRQLALLLCEKRAKSGCVAKIIFLSRLPARPWQSPGRCFSESFDLRDLTDDNKPPRAKIPAFIEVLRARIYVFKISKKFFNLSAALSKSLSIKSKVAEGFDFKTLQHEGKHFSKEKMFTTVKLFLPKHG